MFKKILAEKKKFKKILTNKRFLRDENKCVWVKINAHR